MKNQNHRISGALMAVTGFMIVLLLTILTAGTVCAESVIDQTPTLKTKNDLRVITLSDVVSGDSVLLESGGEYLLIDGGNPGSGAKIAAELKKYKVQSVSLYLTHYHPDHSSGILELLRNQSVRIKRLYLPNGKYLTSADPKKCLSSLDRNRLERSITCFRKLYTYAGKRNIPVTYLKAGSSFTFGRLTASVLSGCNVNSAIINQNWENNNSLVTRFASKSGAAYLSMGDAGRLVQKRIMDSGTRISASVMSLPHHGISANLSLSFLEAVDPSYVYYTIPEQNGIGKYSSVSSGVKTAQKVTNVFNTTYNGRLVFFANQDVVSAKIEKNVRYVIRKRRRSGQIYSQKVYLNKAQSTTIVKMQMLTADIRGN